MRLAREGGDGRARRQGRDARARRRQPRSGPSPARCGPAAPARAQARGSVERVLRRTRGATSASWLGSWRARAALTRGRPRRSAHAGRAARLRAARRARRASWSHEARRRRARELHCGGPVSPPGCDAGAFYAPAVITGRDPADAPHARADRRPGPRRRAGGLDRRGDRAGQRRRLRPGRLGMDAPTATRGCASRASCRRGWCG